MSARGLTPQELAIMNLWDGGFSTRGIARQLALAPDRVERTVTYYHGRADLRDHTHAMQKGSAQLLAAVQRARTAEGLAA